MAEYSQTGGRYGGAGGDFSTPSQHQPPERMQQTQAQVDQVVDIMKDNMNKVMERDVTLSELDNRTQALTVCSF